MKKLHIDLETYSDIDVTEIGAFKYAESPSTEILIFGYAVDKEPVKIWLPWHNATVPDAILEAVEDDDVALCAHNVQFEYAVLSSCMRALFGPLKLKRWHCTAARSAAVGYPRSLEEVAKRLGLKHQKDVEGAKLIKRFCQPQKPTKNQPLTRILPTDDKPAFKRFMGYCGQDVEVEREIDDAIPELPPGERAIFLLDMHINRTGIPIDLDLVDKSVTAVRGLESRYVAESMKLTGGLKPTQRERLLEWFAIKNCPLPNLQIETVRGMLANKNVKLAPEVRKLLELRIETSRASTKKLARFQMCAGHGDRIRGVYLYAGAHTLRWSSKLTQMHNMVRGYGDPDKVQLVLSAFRTGDADLIWALLDEPLFELSQCIRGFIVAPEGYEFGVCDYSQIEARNVDWFAGNDAGIAEWSSGIDKYKLMAMKIYGIQDIEDISDEQRRIGKNTVLGAGFGMSAAAFKLYANDQGGNIDDEEAELAIGVYREVNHQVVSMWSKVENAAIGAITNPGQRVNMKKCFFEMVEDWLTIGLQSGRRIWYPKARVTMGKTKYGRKKEGIVFDGAYAPEHTYGAKVTENIVQGFCRDIMANGLLRAVNTGREVVGHTHDEGIFLARKGQTRIEELKDELCKVPPWAAGMPIAMKGFVTPFYIKD